MSPRKRRSNPMTHWCQYGAQIAQRRSRVRRGTDYVEVIDWRDEDDWRVCYALWPVQELRKHAPVRPIAAAVHRVAA